MLNTFLTRLAGVAIALLLPLFFLPRSFADDNSAASYYEKTLKERGIEPTVSAISKYLKELHPSEDQTKLAARLISQMGDADSFQSREEAMNRLLVMPTLPAEMLTKASIGKDPEIRWRALHILKVGRPESERVMFAVFQYIKEKKVAGLTDEVLKAIPLADKRHIQYAAKNALATIAQPDDAPVLREALASELPTVRIAAANALARSIGEKATPDLQKLLKDEDATVQVAAARAMANAGSREAFAPLLEMLNSDDLTTRSTAISTLRQWTKQNFKFAAYSNADARKEAVNQWRKWVAESGKTAKLHFPLSSGSGATGDLAGNTLLAFGYTNRVAEIDPSGKELWAFTDCAGAWSAEKLINGNVLIACHSQSRVIEVDRDKKIVWEFPCSSPLNAKPLANGNVLIGDYGASRAIEVDREKNIVWEYKGKGSCSEAHRLENGNTLMAFYSGSILEVTPKGETVWEYPLNTSYGLSPLPDGNVLITSFNGKVIEVNRDKKIVWEFSEGNAVDAIRLDNGNTLITSSSRFIEVTPDKKIVWTKTGCSNGSARR